MSQDAETGASQDTSRRINQEETHHVTGIPDYNFPLYRHWTLYDSMRFSRRVSAGMLLWTSRGQQHFELLFAKIGIPLHQAQARWNNMSVTHRRELKQNVEETAGDAGLSNDDVLCRGFVRGLGDSLQLSAVDAVLLLNAAMEPWDAGSSGAGAMLSPMRESIKGSPAGTKRPSTLGLVSENYWTASAVLGEQLRGPYGPDDLTQQWLAEATEIQRAVAVEGCSLIEKGLVVRSGAVRYALLPNSRDTPLFATSPSALSRLAIFVSTAVDAFEADKDRRRKTGANPREDLRKTVLCAHNEMTATYLVAGATAGHDRTNSAKMRVDADGSEDPLNDDLEGRLTKSGGDASRPITFRHLFNAAARLTDTRLIQTSLDGCVVEVHKDDVKKFVECLNSGAVE
jgi:cell division control protein 45